MATLFRPLLRPQTLGLGLGATLMTFHTMRQPPMRLDTLTSADSSYRRTAQTPMIPKGGGLNATAVRQVTSGSIIGSLTPFQYSSHPANQHL